MMSIFIARHLISIIAQIVKKAMKVPQKKTALKVQQKKEEILDGQKKFCAWCIGNFLVGDTSSLEAKQKFR